MKKILFLSMLTIIALSATAAKWSLLPGEGGRYELTATQNIDTLKKQGTTTQEVFNALETSFRNFYFNRFQVSCLATDDDMESLPDGAYISGIALNGQNKGGDRTLILSAYAENISLRDQTTDGMGIDNHPFPDADLLIASNVVCNLPENEERTELFNFDIEPFLYEGNSVLITLDISIPEGDTVNFAFDMAPAAAQNAVVIRTEKHCINDMVTLLPVFLPEFDFNFNAAQLPAFSLRYFTNDIRGRITDATGNPVEGLSVRIKDEVTGRRLLGVRFDEDGTFSKTNVDVSHTYSLTITGDGIDSTIEGLAFESEHGDIVLNIQLGNTQLYDRGDVNGDGEVSIADITMLVNLVMSQSSNERSDVNGDGETGVSDISLLVSILMEE